MRAPTRLDDEARAALRRAAVLAGDPGLAAQLEPLVLRHLTTLGDGGRSLQMRHLRVVMLGRSRDLERARDAIRPLPLVACRTARVRAYVHPDLGAADFALAEEARKLRVAAAAIDPDDRRPADRAPGGPLWNLGWALAEMWGRTGGYVGKSATSRFAAFAGEVFVAAGEELTERLVNELAGRWQANLTAGRGKPTLPSAAA
jgi:hypothetical protein